MTEAASRRKPAQRLSGHPTRKSVAASRQAAMARRRKFKEADQQALEAKVNQILSERLDELPDEPA
jgi:hypothetical protein